MTWVAVGVGAAASIGGAAISANAAGDAADTQSEAAQAANMQQMMAQQQMRQDLQPWVDTGRGANSLLSQYLGVGGVGSGGRTSLGLATGLTPTQLREQLAGRFTRSGAPAGAPAGFDPANIDSSRMDNRALRGYQDLQSSGADRNALYAYANRYAPPQQIGYTTTGERGRHNYGEIPVYGAGQLPPPAEIDEAGLQAAMDQYYREQEEQNAQAAQDPRYGSLLRAYRNGADFDSGPAFSFTGKDLASEPGYQFGLQQGQQGIDRAQASRGNFLSGAAIKEASRFNQDYAGTKFNEGFNRASSTYGTNLARRQNEWNTNRSGYDANRNSIYQYLTGASGMGQASAARVGASNQQAVNQIGENTMGAANAQSAAQIATGRAMTNGLNQAANAFSTNNPNSAAGWNSLLTRNGGGYSDYTPQNYGSEHAY